MEPIFKVGDKVRVKKREYDVCAYKHQFIDKMAELSGKIYTIAQVYPNNLLNTYQVKDDCTTYILKEKPYFLWSSGMLEIVEKVEENKNKQKEKIINAIHSSLKKQGIKV